MKFDENLNLLMEDLGLLDFMKHYGVSDFTKKFLMDRYAKRKPIQSSYKLKSIMVSEQEDYITFVFDSIPTNTNDQVKVSSPPSMRLSKSAHRYTEYIRVLDFFKLAETKPGYKKYQLSMNEVKDIMRAASIQVWCDCPSFHWQGDNYIASMVNASVYPTKIKPRRWNLLHNDDNFVCKHLSVIFSQIKFWINPMASMINKYLKTKEGMDNDSETNATGDKLPAQTAQTSQPAATNAANQRKPAPIGGVQQPDGTTDDNSKLTRPNQTGTFDRQTNTPQARQPKPIPRNIQQPAAPKPIPQTKAPITPRQPQTNPQINPQPNTGTQPVINPTPQPSQPIQPTRPTTPDQQPKNQKNIQPPKK
jgi:hypothetical protein